MAAEKDLSAQCEKYCHLDKLLLDEKSNREADLVKTISNRVLIIDTEGIYIYKSEKHNYEQIFELDKLIFLSPIKIIKEIINNELDK